MRSWEKDQLNNVARCSLLAIIRSRIPPSSSRAIPRPVSLAFATMSLLILWFVHLAKRCSLPESFFRRRRLALVPLVCNFSAQLAVTIANVLHRLALVDCAVTIYSNIRNAHVNTQEPSRVGYILIIGVANLMQVKLPLR